MEFKDQLKKLIQSTGIFFIGTLGSKIIMYILTPIYTSYLTTEEYGVAEILYTTVQILIPLLSIKIASAMFRFTAGKEKEPGKMLTNSMLVIFLAFLVVLVGYTAIWRFLDFGINPVIFSLLFLTIALGEVLTHFTKAINKNVIYSLNSILTAGVLLGVNCLLLISFRLGVNGYFISLIVANAFSCFFAFFSARLWRFASFRFLDGKSVREMIRYSWPLVPGALSFWVIQSSDKYMVLWIVGSSATGLLSVAYKIPNLCGTMVNIFSQAWELSAIENVNDSKYYQSVFKKYFITVVVCSSFLILLTKPLSSVLFKGDFYEAHRFVPLLIFSFSFCYFQTFFESIFVAAKNTKSIMISSLIGALLNIVLNIVFIVRFSVIGAVYATGFSYLAVFLIRYFYLLKVGSIKTMNAFELISLAILLAQALFATIFHERALMLGVFFFLIIAFLQALSVFYEKNRTEKIEL